MALPLLREPRLLEDEVYLPTKALATLLLHTFGDDLVEFEPETIKQGLERRYGEIGEVTEQHIYGVRAMMANESAWVEWEAFEKVCAVINSSFPIFSFIQPPESEDVKQAFYVMGGLGLPWEFHNEVKRYAAAACLNDGLWYFDEELSILNPALLEHDSRFGIDRDFAAVKKALESGAKATDNPSNFVDVQVTRVLRAREDLESYKKLESEGLARVKAMLK